MVVVSNKRRKLIGSVRKCIIDGCDKSEVYTGRWKYHWHPYQEGYICQNHYSKLIGYKKRTPEMRKKYNAKYARSKVKFIDKQVIVSENPKTGYCSWCSNNIHDGSCKVTNMHHIEYNDKNVLANTIEICASCHAKETSRLRKPIDRSKRFCVLCGSKTTYYNVKTDKYLWTRYKDGYICNVCYSRINYYKYYKKKG